MGDIPENEVQLRKYAKAVKAEILENHNIDRAVEIINKHEGILTYDYGRGTYRSLLPTIRHAEDLKYKYQYLERIIQVGFEIYEKRKNYEELVFFAAASCNEVQLRLCMNQISKANYNKTKEGDTILLFFIKYSNLENDDYLKILNILVNEYKLEVNKADYNGHSPIIILLNKYVSLQSKDIKEFNSVILNAVSTILTRNNVDLLSHKINQQNARDIIEANHLNVVLDRLKINKSPHGIQSEIEDDKSILFTLLAQKREKDFLQKLEEMTNEKENLLDIEDGNNTLLQLACEKNLKLVVSHLIKQGADLTKTTNRNRKTPLEITARRNFDTIFRDLLGTNKIVIDSKLFAIFVLNRARQIKTKYFDEMLCYDGLQVDIAYDNGNTPLHYAIIFSNTDAILKLLKRGASLLAKNKTGKDPLDYITKEDLELYMDQCILVDKHNKLFDKKYELRFDFNGFLKKDASSNTVVSEAEIASKICSSERLRSLAKHPLMMTFIEIKWNLVSSFYRYILWIHTFLFIYSFILAAYIGHITLLYLVMLGFLIFCTFQLPLDLKKIKRQDILSPSLHVAFTLCVYYLFQNKKICMLLITLTLFYQFLQQHVYYSKYQALMVNGFRKITPYLIALFALHYFNDFENHLKYSKLNTIIFLVISYILIVTYSFNALADSIVDIEYSLKTLYNKNALDFIKFSENMYLKFNTAISNPFIHDNFENYRSQKKGKLKLYLNFLLNRNKFANEKFHFLKLDALTVKKLQDFVHKFNQNDIKQ